MQGCEHGTDDVPIDLLEGLNLGIRAAFVRSLVGGLDMDAHQIVLLQRRDGMSSLGGVVGIEIAGCPGHVDPLPADQLGQTAEQIDGGDHCAANAVKLLERLQSRRTALAPEPDIRYGRLSGFPPGLVDGMIGKHRLACAHPLRQQVAAGAAG